MGSDGILREGEGGEAGSDRKEGGRVRGRKGGREEGRGVLYHIQRVNEGDYRCRNTHLRHLLELFLA